LRAVPHDFAVVSMVDDLCTIPGHARAGMTGSFVVEA